MIKRVIVTVLAIVTLVLGAVAGAAAIWAHGAFDADGVIRSSAGTIDPGPDARSTIIDVDRFQAETPLIGVFGTTRLSVSTGETVDPSNTLFLGAAGTADVDAFVKGSAYAVGIRDGAAWTVNQVPGNLIPPLPRDQTFWLSQDVGRSPAIVVPADRPLTLLMMHPSGIPSGPLTLSVDFYVPNASRWTLGFAIAAVVLLAIGILLLILAIRMRGRRGQHEESGVAPLGAPIVLGEASVPQELQAGDVPITAVPIADAPTTAAAEGTDVLPPAPSDTAAPADAVPVPIEVPGDDTTEIPIVEVPEAEVSAELVSAELVSAEEAPANAVAAEPATGAGEPELVIGETVVVVEPVEVAEPVETVPDEPVVPAAAEPTLFDDAPDTEPRVVD